MTVDVKQVGGTHYDRGGLQHWDLMEAYDVAYLEAVAAKYPVRWRDKGGVEDLRKAVTYLKKMDGRPARRRIPSAILSGWLAANSVPAAEAQVIRLILDEQHGRASDILGAIGGLERLIQNAEDVRQQGPFHD